MFNVMYIDYILTYKTKQSYLATNMKANQMVCDGCSDYNNYRWYLYLFKLDCGTSFYKTVTLFSRCIQLQFIQHLKKIVRKYLFFQI